MTNLFLQDNNTGVIEKYAHVNDNNFTVYIESNGINTPIKKDFLKNGFFTIYGIKEYNNGCKGDILFSCLPFYALKRGLKTIKEHQYTISDATFYGTIDGINYLKFNCIDIF